jgi:hypothetical protein
VWPQGEIKTVNQGGFAGPEVGALRVLTDLVDRLRRINGFDSSVPANAEAEFGALAVSAIQGECFSLIANTSSAPYELRNGCPRVNIRTNRAEW